MMGSEKLVRNRRWKDTRTDVARINLIVAFTLLTSASVAAAQDPATVACQKCHGDRSVLTSLTGSPARTDSLFVPDSMIRDTPHGRLSCTNCHPQYSDGFPHRAPSIAEPCETCHTQQGQLWMASIHAVNLSGDAATCVECHGSHTVYRADDRRSPTHALNVAAMCGSCHADPRIISTYFTAPRDTVGRTAVSQFHETVHGVALTRAGLTVAATCNDCHRAHDVFPADSTASSVNRQHIPETCGDCHQGISETYEASAHGVAYDTGVRTREGKRAPVCVDCHPAHDIVRADEPEWFLGVVEECGECHERLYETYFDTYHGKVTRLGFGLTAKCSDCHTAHEMRPASDPESSVYPVNLVATCRQCHPAANQNFVRYFSHGEPTDRARFPILFWPWIAMTTLLVCVFAFFGVHTSLWLGRFTIDRARARRDRGAVDRRRKKTSKSR